VKTTRIKDQKYTNKDLPHSKKLDIVIVVDMLLTGFDSKFLNTLYVDKNLKHKKHTRCLRLGNFHPLFVFVLATL
jgi:type I site-specific restriction-modification system R (restriction) subunit